MLVPTPMNSFTFERLRAVRHNTPPQLSAYAAGPQARHTRVAVFDESQPDDTSSVQVPSANALEALAC